MPRIKSRYKEPTDLSGIIAREIVAPPISDISIDNLVGDGLIILYREMRNLTILSIRGKLDAISSRDLRDTIKLLFELKSHEQAGLLGLTEENLKELVKKATNDSK